MPPTKRHSMDASNSTLQPVSRSGQPFLSIQLNIIMLSIYCTTKRDMYPQYHNPHDISTVYPFLHSSRLYIRNRHIDHAARGGRGKAWFLGPTRIHNPNSISTVHPSSHGSSLYPTDRHTETTLHQ